MGISYHRKNQLRDYGSDARSLALAGCRWTLQSLRRWGSTVAGWFGLMQRSGPFRFFMELVTFAGVAFTVYSFWMESDARDHNRVHQAWSLVAAHDRGNIGLKKSLEFLNEKKDRLSSVILDQAELYNVQLPGANLDHSHLSQAELSKANLAEAFLRDARLSKAKLSDADLSGAKLDRADLSEAILEDAILTNAELNGTVLVGATLKGATVDDGWSETALLCRTIVPDGSLSDRNCPETLEEDCRDNRGALEDHMKPACNWLSTGNVKQDDYADALIR